jgi:hypothetical protein
MINEMQPCKFTFDDSPEFDGFAHGSTWNGFDNVAVTPAELRRIVQWFAETCPDDTEIAASNRDMLAIAPMENGLVSLGWGYATIIV